MGHRSLRKSAPAKPSRGAVALFAVPGGGKLDGQIKMAKSFGLMRPPFDSTRLEICALPDEVAGEIKPAAIPAEAHIARVLPKPLSPAGPITSNPNDRCLDRRSISTRSP